MPNINPEWVDKLYIGTSATSATPPVWTYAALCAGITQVQVQVNEQNQQAFYMCGQGGANNEVTGIAPTYQISGDRVYGDAAQDFIVGLKYTLGQSRHSSVKIEHYDGATLKSTEVCDCTITDIVDIGGNATDKVPFGCTIRLNGIPTVTPAT